MPTKVGTVMKDFVYGGVVFWKRPLHKFITQIARLYLKFFSAIEVIGITGSVGKTLTQNAIFAILSQKYKVVVGEENLDPTFRIPQTILKLRPGDQKIILEYGVERPGEMDYYLSVVRPVVAIITSVAPTHTKYFGSVRGVFEEKAKLASGTKKGGIVFLNGDDQNVVKMKNQLKEKVKFYGRRRGSIKYANFSQNAAGSRFDLVYQKEKVRVGWKAIGEHHLVSVLAAAEVGLYENMTLSEIAQGLSKSVVPLHRLNIFKTKNFTIIDDTYNASPAAMLASLQTLFSFRNNFKVAILGEMKDLGSISNDQHRKVGRHIAGNILRVLITIGEQASLISKEAKKFGFGGEIHSVSSTSEAIKVARRFAANHPLVLVKGSRHAHLERVVYALSNKSTQISCYHCGILN